MLTLPALAASRDIRLSAAFDVRLEARERFAREFGGTPHGSLEGLLADAAVQAVYIASPHALHADQTIAAVNAGKHVLVEKPMATTVADCRAMVDAARIAQVVLMVGPSHGFDPPVQRAAEMVASGAFGRVRMVTTFNFTDFMYRPRRPEELDPEQGGGVVHSQAAHQFDVVRRIVGKRVEAITAVVGDWDSARPGGAYTAFVRFEGDVAATLTYSGYGHYDSDELLGWVSELGRDKNPDAHGQARRAVAGLSSDEEARRKLTRAYGPDAKADAPAQHHEHFGFVLVSCDAADLKVTADGVWVFADDRRQFIPVPVPAVPRAGVIAAFAAAVRGQRPVIHDGEWGLTTMRCCAALIRSSVTGRTVSAPDI